LLASVNRVAAAERKSRTAQQMSFVFGKKASAGDIAEARLESGAGSFTSETVIALDTTRSSTCESHASVSALLVVYLRKTHDNTYLIITALGEV
jgi:hypothetical protein